MFWKVNLICLQQYVSLSLYPIEFYLSQKSQSNKLNFLSASTGRVICEAENSEGVTSSIEVIPYGKSGTGSGSGSGLGSGQGRLICEAENS